MNSISVLKTSILFLSFLFFFSCKKEGVGGKATISGTIQHHGLPVPNATVYIKYGAKDLPGTDPSNYDASVQADSNAKYEIKNLQKGDYYLFSIGYDPSISQTVKGGFFVEIKSKKSHLNIDIPVTE